MAESSSRLITLALKFLGLITVLICLPLFLESSFFAQYFLKVLLTLQSPASIKSPRVSRGHCQVASWTLVGEPLTELESGSRVKASTRFNDNGHCGAQRDSLLTSPSPECHVLQFSLAS